MEAKRISYSDDIDDYGGKGRNNWDDRDKKLLLDIVATMDNGKVKKILDKKSLKTNMEKADVWIKITDAFNQATSKDVDRATVRTLYNRIKNVQRKEYDAQIIARDAQLRKFKQTCSKTGSGSAPQIPQELDGDLVRTQEDDYDPIPLPIGSFTGPVSSKPVSTCRPSVARLHPSAPSLSEAITEISTEEFENPRAGKRIRESMNAPSTNRSSGLSNARIRLIGVASSGDSQENIIGENVVDPVPPKMPSSNPPKGRQTKDQVAMEFYRKSLTFKEKMIKYRKGGLMQKANLKSLQLRFLEDEAERKNMNYELPFPVVPYPNQSSESEESD